MEFIDQLKSTIDIVQVIQEYVPLKKAGPVRWVGLCPFHTEKTPSFSVHAGHQFYKCFGCGAGGDAFKFVMELEGFSFWEAATHLAERYGVPVPRRNEYADEDTRLRAVLYELHEIAQRAFRAALESPAGSGARGYLERRGISRELAEEFGLGYSDRAGQAIARQLQQRGFAEAIMEQSGLVKKRPDGSGFYDAFRGRLMFPIHNESAKLVAFAGRALSDDDQPKYLNSPQTPIYYKSSVLYNLHRARNVIRKEEHAILVEGYMDVIGLHQAGIRQSVASCGTALTNQQVRVLRRHSANVVVNFDPDNAGANAAERSIQLMLDESLHIRILELDEGLDPDEYVRQRGVETYRQRLARAQRYFLWLADRARKKFDMTAAEGRVAGFQFLLPAIQRIPDKIERVAVANDVAGYLGVDAGLVLEQFRKAAAAKSEAPLRAPKRELPAGERILLKCLLENEAARREILPRLRDMSSASKLAARKIFDAMAMLDDRYSFPALEARLEDPEKDLLAGILLADENNEEPVSVEQALACLDRIREGDRASERAAMKAKVKAAEQSGNLEEAIHLYRQLQEMEKSPS
ncbi:MAG: DNA primase [Bryobacteraceae bacterium]